MSDVTGRALELLSLLQSHAVRTGPELAEALGVTVRSVRRDVERLRTLGYPVHASHGHGGGYRLGAGRALPPLLLRDAEAVAMTVGLRLAATVGIDGLGQDALGALAALDPMLPPTARAQVTAIGEALEVLGGAGGVDPAVLVTTARAVREHRELRLDYVRADGERGARRVEPYRVLSLQGRWYLFAWDRGREDWRTFRLDRMESARMSTFAFPPRATPDIAEHVREAVTRGARAEEIVVRVALPAGQVTPRVPESVGTVSPEGESACILRIPSGDPLWTALHLARLDLPLTAVEPESLRQAIAQLGAWSDRTRDALGSGERTTGDSQPHPEIPSASARE